MFVAMSPLSHAVDMSRLGWQLFIKFYRKKKHQFPSPDPFVPAEYAPVPFESLLHFATVGLLLHLSPFCKMYRHPASE